MIYALILLILMGLILNSILKKYVLYNLAYKREISKCVVEIGEEFEIATIVENNKALPVTFLQVIEKYPSVLSYKFKANFYLTKEYLFHRIAMHIIPYQRIKRTYKVFCTQRGRHIFSDTTLIGGDLLGLDTFSKEIEYLQDIIVLPQRIDLENEIVPYGNYYGDFSVKRWIIDDPVLTVGIREYTGYEPLKTIHWPSSLKSGQLMVKKFDFTSDNTVMVILNIECFKPFWQSIDHDSIEKCISIARAVMEQFEESGIPYGLTVDAYYSGILEGGSIDTPGYGDAHFQNILENLGRIAFDICMPFEELLSNLIRANENYTTFVIITPLVLEQYIDLINDLSEKAMRTVLISLEKQNLDYLRGDITTFIERRD